MYSQWIRYHSKGAGGNWILSREGGLTLFIYQVQICIQYIRKPTHICEIHIL